MTFFRFGLAFLFLLMASFTTTNAFAQADKTGIDLRVGLSVPFYTGASTAFETSRVNASQGGIYVVGVGLDVQALYRWKNVGLGVEQLLSAAIAYADSSADTLEALGVKMPDETGLFKFGDAAFYGATYFIVKSYFPIGKAHLITITPGVGVAYGAGIAKKHIFGNESDLALSIKADFGYTYFIQDKYGIGFNLEYQAHVTFDKHPCYISKDPDWQAVARSADGFTTPKSPNFWAFLFEKFRRAESCEARRSERLAAQKRRRMRDAEGEPEPVSPARR